MYLHIWIIICGLTLFACWLVMLVLMPEHFKTLYQRHFVDARRERMFLSSVSFFVTFAIARLIAFTIHINIGPFQSIVINGLHVHHLVFGILLLLLVGYLWLLQIGTGIGVGSVWSSRIIALVYGFAAALTLDEFALWLHLEDVYWTIEGQRSIEAIILFGGLLSIGLWGKPFFRSVIVRAITRLLDLLRLSN